MKRKILHSVVLLAMTAPLVAVADQLSLKLENDILAAGNDGHYTNGFELGAFFAPDQDHWLRSVGTLLPGWSAADVGVGSYRFGQQIYTPENIDQDREQLDDRPYAGLLYLGFSVFNRTQKQGWRETGEFDVDIGMVGPAAGGEQVQRGVHQLTGSSEPQGWDHQLNNEPFLQLGYEQRWWLQQRFAGLELEYGPSAGAAVGNLYTYASSGLGLRFGQGLTRSAGIPSAAPSFAGNQYFQPGAGLAWYGFANLQGRFMARNLLLDGGSDDHTSIDRRDWVGDAQVGVALSWEDWQVALATVWRTREFEQQNQHDQFGSLTISTTF